MTPFPPGRHTQIGTSTEVPWISRLPARTTTIVFLFSLAMPGSSTLFRQSGILLAKP